MPWTGDKQGPHIDKTRLQAAAETKFELTVEELRHMLKCNECLDTLTDLRNKYRAKKASLKKKLQT
jgi:hypothetical protein